MSPILPPVVTPLTVQGYLDALITLYVDRYLQGVEQAPTDVAYQSSFEALAKRAVKAYERVVKHPYLFQEIYEDFKLEFQDNSQELSQVIAVRQHV